MKRKLFLLPTATAVVDPGRWVATHADYLYSYAMGRLDDEAICQDLVQETFLAALERLGEFRGQSSERTWLTAILKYKVIDVYRRRNSSWVFSGGERGGNGAADDAEPDFFDAGNGHWKEAWAPRPMSIDQQDEITQKELGHILQDCLRRLPALWLTIFSMKHLDDMKAEAICRELKVTASNYWVILHRAKVNLRACIERRWG
ncbi:MAG TPA: sigma-70 family RNA polymerase sigma factor [Puia sp.]|nr:sigma-70 family RNA polymerase sigma factor [Puia sp.]